MELESRFNGLSTVSQNPARYQTFTVEENVLVGDTLSSEDRADLLRAISFAGVEDIPSDAVLGKEVGGTDLSGGQWQKLAIARQHTEIVTL